MTEEWKRPTDQELWDLRERAEAWLVPATAGRLPSIVSDVLNTIPPKPKPKKIEAWVNEYDDGSMSTFRTKKAAERSHLYTRATRVAVRLIEAEEGEAE